MDGTVLQLFDVFCAYKKCLYFIKIKHFAFLVFIRVFCILITAFCKPLDLNSHYVLKIVGIVCDGIVGRHYSQILRRYCVLVAFLITGLEYKILAHCL